MQKARIVICAGSVALAIMIYAGTREDTMAIDLPPLSHFEDYELHVQEEFPELFGVYEVIRLEERKFLTDSPEFNRARIRQRDIARKASRSEEKLAIVRRHVNVALSDSPRDWQTLTVCFKTAEWVGADDVVLDAAQETLESVDDTPEELILVAMMAMRLLALAEDDERMEFLVSCTDKTFLGIDDSTGYEWSKQTQVGIWVVNSICACLPPRMAKKQLRTLAQLFPMPESAPNEPSYEWHMARTINDAINAL